METSYHKTSGCTMKQSYEYHSIRVSEFDAVIFSYLSMYNFQTPLAAIYLASVPPKLGLLMFINVLIFLDDHCITSLCINTDLGKGRFPRTNPRHFMLSIRGPSNLNFNVCPLRWFSVLLSNM